MKKNKIKSWEKIFLFLLYLVFAAPSISADHRDQLFEQGIKFFQDGEYGKAVQSFDEILGMGYESAGLYYNLGNSYYKIGENVRAILNYERALRLSPRDEDIRFNLSIANLNVIDKIQEIPELFYVRYFNEFRSLFDIRTLTFLTLGIYFLFFFLLILWLTKRLSIPRWVSKFFSILLLFLLLSFSFTFISKIQNMRNNVQAIVLSPEVDVRSAPSEDGTEIFTIHEGLKVKIIDNSGDWREIRLTDGKEGWLPAIEMEVI